MAGEIQEGVKTKTRNKRKITQRLPLTEEVGIQGRYAIGQLVSGRV